jgi:hypothetical protein
LNINHDFKTCLSNSTPAPLYNEGESNKAALLGSVCSCALSAVSPQILLWIALAFPRQ